MPFVGRKEQIDSLRELWDRSKDGATQFVFVSGQAGYGKTRLLDEFMNSLPSATRIIRVRCYEAERRVAFSPIIRLLGDHRAIATELHLRPIWLASLADLVPDFSNEAVGSLPRLSPSGARGRLHEAILQFLAAVAKPGPLVVAMDDVQWCDQSTGAFLSLAWQRLTSCPIMFVVAGRTPKASNVLRQPWQNWKTVTVRELKADDVAAALKGDDAHNGESCGDYWELYRLTAGHPYLLSEAVKARVYGGCHDQLRKTSQQSIAGVHSFVTSILNDISTTARNVLQVMAVLARPASIAVVRRVARANGIARAIDELATRELVTINRGRIGIRHDLIRESAYKQIPKFTKIDLHRRAAIVLSCASARAGETAVHFYKARQRKRAYQCSLMAVEEADRRYANDECIYFTKLAIKCADPDARSHLQVHLIRRLHRAHRLQEAREHLQTALSSDVRLPAMDNARLSLLDMEMAYSLGKLKGEAVRANIEVLSTGMTLDNSVLLQALRLELRSAYHDGAKDVLSSTISRLRHFADQANSWESLDALALAARTHALIESVTEAEHWSAAIRGRVVTIADPELRISVLAALVGIYYDSGRLRDAEALSRKACAEIEAVGATNMWPLVASNTHMILVEQGMYTEASELAKEITKRSQSIGGSDSVATVLANAAIMQYEQGEYALALKTASSGLLQLGQRKSIWAELGLRGLAGLAALELGNVTLAFRHSDDSEARLDNLGLRISDLSYLEILIARTHRLRNRRAAAIQRLRQAVDDYRDRDVVCRLRLYLELARLVKSSDRNEARSITKFVFDAARAINARPLAERADSFLQRF